MQLQTRITTPTHAHTRVPGKPSEPENPWAAPCGYPQLSLQYVWLYNRDVDPDQTTHGPVQRPMVPVLCPLPPAGLHAKQQTVLALFTSVTKMLSSVMPGCQQRLEGTVGLGSGLWVWVYGYEES
jgi:hypothetical protein